MNELLKALTELAQSWAHVGNVAAALMEHELAGKTGGVTAATAPIPAAPEPEKPAKPRAKKEKAVSPAATEPAPSPFGIPTGDAPTEATNVLSAEEAIEAGRRGQEVMGLFIRRYLKASPTGLERAKKIVETNLGKPRNGEAAWKMEHFTPGDWLKLTAVFEAELDKA